MLTSSMPEPENHVELPGVSERRPVAFATDTPPGLDEAVFVYSPTKGEWVIGLFPDGK